MARVIVAGKYQLLKKIGEGSFGKIFRSILLADPSTERADPSTERADPSTERALAIKITEHSEIFKNEVQMYEKLRGLKGVPTMYASGIEGKFKYIVMDLLEQSLEQVLQDQEEPLPLKVVIHLALQMLAIVEQIHALGIIHRDLKPANFLLKTNAQQISELVLIDFGLAKCLLDEKNRHCVLNTNEPLVGSTRYMSINMHHGFTASRRDDLESLGYIILFFYQGQLSWQKQSAVVELKQKLTFIGTSDSIRNNFILFILYCRDLGFADKPHYDYLCGILENVKKLT
jgi:serine/threonine protein kinase